MERRDDFFEYVQAKLSGLSDEDGLYARIFQLICHLNFSPAEAKEHWKKIKELKEERSARLGRAVSFRVALLDYFLSNQTIQTPMIVELYLFENHRYNVMVDNLTGLYNHRFIREYLWKETKRSIRYKKKYSVLLMDVDDFAEFNDRNGKIAGDELLMKIAAVLENHTRVEDVPARFGGDEFFIILPETDRNGAMAFANRIKKILLDEVFSSSKLGKNISVSMGLATFQDDSVDPILLLEMVEKSLYHAKYLGKNKIEAYSFDELEI